MIFEDRPVGGVFINRSGTIAADATAQTVCQANASRRYFRFQNISDTDMWLDFDGDAVADSPSLKVAAAGVFEPLVPPVNKVSVICATAGKKFTCKEA